MLIRMGEVDSAHLWKIGKDIALLLEGEREQVTKKFTEWEDRDAGVGEVAGNKWVVEIQKSVDADY